MNHLSAAEIREAFLSFYADRGHFREKSASLLPQNDPTLLFTAAGMVPFKNVFTGIEKRDYSRATTAQRCVRAGGKHNDLENVGFTKRHQTFFEMLGNFSFGDYFKKDAIKWAWEFSTEVLKLPKDRLYVSVHTTDDEAAEIWEKEIGIEKERIYRFDEDNFWAAGDVGPCGPCSEMFFDRGEAFNTGDPELDRMGGDGDRFLEYYNLVFMQFERDENGDMNPLPKPSVDTGMGLERITSIVQEVSSNYETDLFTPIIHTIKSASPTLKSKVKVGEVEEPAKLFADLSQEEKVATQVVADHLRAVSYLIADGLLPSNEGAGYVLRRILRRAVRFGKNIGFNGSFMHKMVPIVTEQLAKAHPVLREKESHVQTVIKAEEEKFFLTLEKGLAILNEELEGIKEGGTLSGKTAFLLYDSFGFPLDLTEIITSERNIKVDAKEFEESMAKQKSQSKAKEEKGKSEYDAVYRELSQKLAETNFTGYDSYSDLKGSGELLALLDGGNVVSEVAAGAEKKRVQAIFDTSVLYAESGGQIGDTGELVSNGSSVAIVRDVKKPFANLAVAHLDLLPNTKLKTGESVEQIVDRGNRKNIANNHTATHLLHWALREVLGEHVKQAGSLVRADILRFDFTHMQAMTTEQIEKVESMVNDKIDDAYDVLAKTMAKDDAIAAGAMALFGEKYGDEVRVLTIGDFSVELCGGTHVRNTSQIRLFVITEETGIAAGTRRITARTGKSAFEFLKTKADIADAIRNQLKAGSQDEVIERLHKIQANNRDLEKKIGRIEERNAAILAKQIAHSPSEAGNFSLITHQMEGDAKAARSLVEKVRQHFPSGVIAVAAESDGKAFLLVSVSKDLSKRAPAGKLVQAAAPKIEGRGGGKPEMAQAGGTNIAGLKDALLVVRQELSEITS